MTTLSLMPPRVPLVDPRTGMITREWYLFFVGTYDRVGGSDGSSTTDLSASMFEDAGIEELKSATFHQYDELRQQPPHVPFTLPDDQQPVSVPLATFEVILTEMQGLREQVAELTKTIQSLQQGTSI